MRAALTMRCFSRGSAINAPRYACHVRASCLRFIISWHPFCTISHDMASMGCPEGRNAFLTCLLEAPSARESTSLEEALLPMKLRYDESHTQYSVKGLLKYLF